MEDMQVREEILDATVALFNENGLKFTMDSLAAKLHRSKKTLYVFFPDKKSLLNAMVDYIFDSIKRSEQQYLEDPNLGTEEKLYKVLGAMPEQYQSVDFGKLYILKEKYPKIYQRVEERLENGWESTIMLLNQGMEEGIFREVSIPVFKTMMQATLEQFFQRDILVENHISYQRALEEVVTILISGIVNTQSGSC